MLTAFAALLAAATPAHAIDMRFYGVGPTLNFQVAPAQYPAVIPKFTSEGVRSGDPGIDGTGMVMAIGAKGVAYPGKIGRINGEFDLGFGSDFNRQELVLGYDKVMFKDGTLQALVGGGVGVGHERFGGNDDAPDGSELNVTYYPVKVGASGLLRDKTRAYELGLYGSAHLVGSQQWCTDADTCVTPSDTSAGIGKRGMYYGIGLEGTVYFGDFKTKDANKGGGGKKGGGKKGGGKKGGGKR